MTETPAALETREVLAVLYRGKRASLAATLTHYAVPGTDSALCGRIAPDGLCDRPVAGPPSCPALHRPRRQDPPQHLKERRP